MKSYFFGTSTVVFDYSDIRPKGNRLVTSGGKAPGPEPLKDCIHNISKILDRKKSGEQLQPIEAHDIVCFIADAVLSGGIRRAALISLFSFDDEEMLMSKFNHWYETEPQRGRANNSAVALRYRITEDDWNDLWGKIEAGRTGEPGIVFVNDSDNYGFNPCNEVSLRKNAFCNLTTINASDVLSQSDLNDRVRAASFIGTLQAAYTDFHFLRDIWKRNTEKDALIGVSMTGIASGTVFNLDLKEAANIVKSENERVAKLIGINKAARTCCIKPEGSSSLLLGCSSGIHSWHSPYYIRRIRVGKNEAIYKYLAKNHPELVEDDFFKPTIQAIISVPVKAPDGAITRNNETAIDLLERVKKFNKEWIRPGHRSGPNRHNVSATITIKDDEWQEVGEWMWKNRDYYNGLSVLPHDGGTYTQAPFEEITKEQYEDMVKHLKVIDLTKIIEEDDETDLKGEIACGGGACEIT